MSNERVGSRWRTSKRMRGREREGGEEDLDGDVLPNQGFMLREDYASIVVGLGV